MRVGLFQRVYDIVERIPAGQVVTYGQIAEALGNPRLARRVGQAMFAAPEERALPWHRVVKAGGYLAATAFAEEQRALLQGEGVPFRTEDCERVDLAACRWPIEFDDESLEAAMERFERARPAKGSST